MLGLSVCLVQFEIKHRHVKDLSASTKPSDGSESEEH
jgi:hypothetical protein